MPCMCFRDGTGQHGLVAFDEHKRWGEVMNYDLRGCFFKGYAEESTYVKRTCFRLT